MAGPLKMESWERGITDDYEDAPVNFARMLNNLFLNKRGKPFQRFGVRPVTSGLVQLPTGTQKIDAVYYFDSTIFVKSATKLYYVEGSGTSWTELLDPESRAAFVDSELGAKVSWSEWKGHLFATANPGSTKKSGCRTVMIYRNTSSVWTCVQAGLPRAEDGTLGGIEVEASGDENVLAYEMFYRTYVAKVDGVSVTFEDYGKPQEKRWEYVDIASCENGTLAWTNGSTQGYADSGMSVRSFRTKSNDTTPLYNALFGQGGTITYTVTEANLGQEAYFAGGVQYWDPIPLCFYSVIIDSCAFYIGGKDVDSGEVYNTRMWQSDPANPKGVPASNYCDVPVKYQGAGKVGVYPIVFGRKDAFRIEGRFDKYGNGGMVPKRISATEGCIAADAIVETPMGLFFPSETGWCFTDGFQVVKLSEHLADSYKALQSKSGMSGCCDVKNGRIFWAVEDTTLDAVNTGNPNALYVLDLNHSDIAQGRGSFQTATGHPTYATISPTAMHYDSVNDRILLGDRRGYVFWLSDNVTSDIQVQAGVAVGTWGRVPIIWKLRTVATAFGAGLLTKYCTRFRVVAKNVGASFSVDLSSQVDDSTTEYASKEIRARNAIATGLHKIWRWFAKNSLRCTYRQVNLTKGFVNILRSDDYALATVNSAAKTVVLATGNWPEDGIRDLIGHSIAFEMDDYVTEYLITNDSTNTLTLSTAPAGDPASKKWVVRGYPKEESCEIHGVEIEFEVEGEQVKGFEGGDTNDNS